jgi:hypothetical protein
MASILKQSGMAMLAVVALWAAAPYPAFAQRARHRLPPTDHRRQHPGWQNHGAQHPGWQNHGAQHPGWQNHGAQHPGWQNHRWPGQRRWRHGWPHDRWSWSYGAYGYGAYAYPGVMGGVLGSPLEGGSGSDFQSAADLIRAQGEYELTYQEARLVNQQVEKAKVDTRRHIYDEWLEERAKRPTLQDEAERDQANELRRALKNAPAQEILSGHTLNIILQDLGARQSQWAAGPATPIDPQILQHVNVTVRGASGTGILKAVCDGGTLSWPMALRGTAYEEETDRIDQGLADAIRGAPASHTIDPDTLSDLLEDLGELRGELSKHIEELTPSDHVQAKRFLDQLGEALRGLQQPGALDRLREKQVPEGRTVPELVRFMTAKGLVFAPAAAGDDAAYIALYNALASNRNASPMPAAQE